MTRSLDQMRPPLPIIRGKAEGRACGLCSECCTNLKVPELDKPAGEPCIHLVAGKGCGIYEDRPQSCRDFSCLWLQGVGDFTVRPDRSHAVLAHMKDQDLTLYVRPEQPERWQRSKFLQRLVQRVVASGHSVFVVGGMAYRRCFTNDPKMAEMARELGASVKES